MLIDKIKDAYVLDAYKESANKTNIYFSHPFEVVAGYIPGKDPEKIIEIWNSIKSCTCGSATLIMRVDETMGDWDCTIQCQDCGRTLNRSMYDFDVNKEIDEISLCIKDWNDGITQKEIDKKQEQEHERKRLKEEDLFWHALYPNNMKENGIEGYYCRLFRKDETDETKYYCCKWTIVFQHKEIEPMRIGSEIESYNLHMKRYFDYENEVKELRYDVNDYGDFVRNYKTLEEAKEGALARCGWQRLNKDTVL